MNDKKHKEIMWEEKYTLPVPRPFTPPVTRPCMSWHWWCYQSGVIAFPTKHAIIELCVKSFVIVSEIQTWIFHVYASTLAAYVLCVLEEAS